jgi:hypothetical protein
MKGSRTVESVGDRLGTKLLTFVLSVIAGSVDVIGFLGLGALFIAHITGNLVVLAARTLRESARRRHSHGRTSEAPPNERGGNRYVRT